ncbi:DUF1697 domain-containing protein [Psychroserpens sp. SPM9]|uniref:DUF1697 domain-containing protein n=1 Tax=Psychroserpens sp. SPM9 TaxID=2975598 RepID=UPI0021A5FBDB|nr:DUF1697 domain-containing protein [Psychroserpens sp. SPM9]MDG5490283.1 DUF1697 domain-containing protein [Psychroserpens sp. SPM9]
MRTYIVLLRGINVGGYKKVPMAELRELLTETGFEEVNTYIQSGNIILQSSETAVQIEAKVKTAIQSHFGFEVSVIAKTRSELIQIFEACPFSEEQMENSYFILLSDIPDAEKVDEVNQITYNNEVFHIMDDCLYFYASIGYGNSKFNMNMFEKKLKVNATSRNYKTMVKLIAMSSENEKDH